MLVGLECWLRLQRLALLLLLASSAFCSEFDGVGSFSCEGKMAGDYPDPLEMCSKNYISCTHGKAILRECPVGLFFDRATRICNWKHNINECQEQQQQQKPQFICPHKEGNFPVSDRICDVEYWRCLDGQARRSFCDKGQVFNPIVAMCQPAVGPCAFCSTRLRGRYPVDDSCSDKYYECAENYGPTVVERCPQPWVYDVHSKLCVAKSSVSTCSLTLPVQSSVETALPMVSVERPVEVPSRETITSTVSTSAPVVWQVPRESGVETRRQCTRPTSIGHCSEEFNGCEDGLVVRRQCKPGHVFYEPYGGCVNKWQSPECSIASDLYPARCQSRPNYKFGKGRCSPEYVQCMDAIPLRQWCPPGQVFDEPSQSCVDVAQRPVCLVNEWEGVNARGLPTYGIAYQCTVVDRQAKRRKPLQRCSSKFVQCDPNAGDKVQACKPDETVYDELYDRCVPSELSNECPHDNGKPFYPLNRKKRFATGQGNLFNPTLFANDRADVNFEAQAMPNQVNVDRSSPYRLTQFGMNKNINLRMEMDRDVMVVTSPPAQQAPAAVIANFENLNFQDGQATMPPPVGQNNFGIGTASSNAIQFVPVGMVPAQHPYYQPSQAQASFQQKVQVIQPQAADNYQMGQVVYANQQVQPTLNHQQQQQSVAVNPFGPVMQNTFCSNKKDGVYSVGDCHQEYAVCRDKRELRLSCSVGQVFDKNSMQCIAPGTHCLPTRVTATPVGTELINLVCLNRANGVYAMAPCTRFYFTCLNGRYRLLQCEFGEVFSMSEKRCVKSDQSCQASSTASVPVGNYPGTSMPKFCLGSFEVWINCANSCMQPTCGQLAPSVQCNAPCTPGCVCRPGYVRLSQQSRMCVPQEACLQYSLTKNSLQQTFCHDRPNGHYSYPGKTCDQQYVKCHAGAVELLQCANGQVFDVAQGQCIGQASCQTPKVSASGLDIYFCRSKPSGSYNLPGKTCFNLYYTCASGAVTFGKCPVGQVFDLHTGCVPPSMCDDGPAHSTDLYCSGRQDGSYPFNNYQCFPVYYFCKSGRVSFAICHAYNQDMVFNGKSCVPREVCQPAHGAVPPLPIHFVSPFNESNTFDVNFCNNQPDGAYPIVECTTPYLVCINSVTTIHYCFPGEVFARVNLPAGVVYQCTQPKYTLCEPKYVNGGGWTQSSEKKRNFAPAVGNKLCTADGAAGKLHSLTSDPCQQYYINCTDKSEFVLLSCPGKLVFDPVVQECKANLNCLSHPPPDYRQLCHDKASGFYTFTLCSPYYLYCQKGIGWVQTCLNHQWVFNGQSMQCAPRQQVVGCQSTLTSHYASWNPAQPRMAHMTGLDVRCKTLGDGGYEISACQSDYIVCNMGFGDVRSCAKGLVFSSRLQRCVPVDQVAASCKVQRGDSLCQAKSDGAYPFAPCDQQFYVCWKQFSYIQKCTGENIFFSRLQSCVNVNSVSVCLAGPKEPVVACSSPGRWSSGPCRSSFSLCVPEGRLITVHCAVGESFDRHLEQCVPSFRCESTFVNQNVFSHKPAQSSAHVVHEVDTRRVVYSSTSRPSVQELSGKGDYVIPATNIRDPVVVESFCVDNADGFYRHPLDCSKFVQCFRRRTYILNCATGLVFNPNVHVCDFARNVPDCNLNAKELEGRRVGPDAAIGSGICANAEHGAFIRDPSSCKRYFRCVHGIGYKFDCPDTLVFNIRLNVCDYPSKVPECSATAST